MLSLAIVCVASPCFVMGCLHPNSHDKYDGKAHLLDLTCHGSDLYIARPGIQPLMLAPHEAVDLIIIHHELKKHNTNRRGRHITMTNINLRRSLATALLSTALTLSACVGTATVTPAASDTSAASPTTESITRQIAADYGTTVEVPADPQRVAVLHPAYVTMYLDLGGKPVAVSGLGEDEVSELPSEQRAAYEAATNVSSVSGEVDFEKLASLEPDVILTLTSESGWEQTKEKLTSIAPTVPVDVASTSDFQFTTLAEATNTLDTLNRQEVDFAERVAEIQQKYSEVLKSVRVVEAYRSGWSEPGTFSINASMCAEVVLDEDVIDFDPTEYSLSFEQISKLADYDLILVDATIDGEPTDASAVLMEENAWKSLPAAQSGHVQPVYCGTWKTYGLMMQYLDGLEKALATLPQPE